MKNKRRWIYYLLLIPICFEVALLVLGYRRYTPIDYTITSSPTYCLSPDANFGFALNPGEFDVTINKGLTYSVTHTKDSLREIPFSSSDSAVNKIYFLGCSFTYGMGVNDAENIPALIQEAMPNTKVKNFGVPGFGTVQSYLQLQKMILENDIPTTVILNYADFHDMRNALTPFYRENLKIGFERSNNEVKSIMQSSRVPYVKEQNGNFSVEFCEWDKLYKHWMLRDVLASVNYLQSQSDINKDKSIPKKEITYYLVKEMQKMCKENDITFIVTGITKTADTKATLKEFARMGIQTIDISVDLSLEKYNNMPFDSHPNKLTHSIWAKRILEGIKK